MAHTVKSLVDNLNVFEVILDIDEETVVTNAQFALLAGAIDNDLLTDEGVVDDVEDVDEIFDQGANVAAQAALTATAPAALTSAAASGGESPTEAEYNALRVDVTALRTTLAAVVVDLAAARTKQNALIAALSGTGKPLASE